MHQVVDGNQYAFIKGEQILDSIPIANECGEEKKRKKKRKGVITKLDLKKTPTTKPIGIS